jgi:hypothetical protein
MISLMPKYLVSYDLDKPGPQNYDRIITEIKRFGGVEVLRSQWVITNKASAAGLRDHFKGFISTNTDRLIVNGIDVADWAAWNAMADINKL